MKPVTLIVLFMTAFLTGCLHNHTQPQTQAYTASKAAPQGDFENVQQVKQVIDVDGSIATLDMAEFAHRR